MTTADDDLDAEFALFEQKIATVSAAAPATTKSLNPPSHLSQPQHTSAFPPQATTQNPPLNTQKHSHQQSTPHPSSKSLRTGKWKWAGTEWKWHIDPPPSQPSSAAISHAPSLTPQQHSNSLATPTVRPLAHSSHDTHADANLVSHKPMKRTAAGEQWTDMTLSDWPENDHRIFVGDLAPDAAEKDLEKAFGKYSSFSMARIVRDKRSGLCKGYGFVSFTKGGDMVAALKEMNGKYVGNRPVKLRKSSWQKRNLSMEKRKELKLMRKIVKK